MLRSWLDVEEIRRFYPSRQFFEKHALAIPAFGIASPLGAGWLLLKSVIEDRRLGATEMLRHTIAGRLPECPKTASTRRAEYGLDRAAPWLRGPDLN